MGVYEAFYKCRCEPFSLSPDPRFLYLAPGHREGLAQMRYAIESRKGFVVLTGEVGTGKTTMLRALLATVEGTLKTAYILNPPQTVRELHAAIFDELGLPWSETTLPARDFNQFLLRTNSSGSTVVLVFDEAQAIPIAVLEEVRLLSNFETVSTKLVQVILAGQPEFEALLDSQALRALRQRVAMRVTLPRLSRQETIHYITHRVRCAGGVGSPLTLSACETVYQYSKGLPRLINLICDHALLTGYASDERIVDASRIREVARDLKLEEAPIRIRELNLSAQRAATLPFASRHRRAIVLSATAIVLFVCVSAAFTRVGDVIGVTCTQLLHSVRSLMDQQVKKYIAPAPEPAAMSTGSFAVTGHRASPIHPSTRVE